MNNITRHNTRYLVLTPAHEFCHNVPELGAHVDPEHGGDGPGQQGAEHGHLPQVQHAAQQPDGQGGDNVDHDGDQEHKGARLILKLIT